MKIEKINDNKIKITLDVNDLATRHIDAKSFVSNTPESQDLFWDVMREAEKIGFNVDESMVYVEAHINNTGVFTLIVTKTQNAPSTAPKSKPKGSSYTLKRKPQTDDKNNNLYKFQNINDLISFCRLIKCTSTDKSSLYSYDNSYYLDTKNCDIKEVFEFASKDANTNYTLSKIYEYGTTIYKENAIKKIKNL